MGSELITVGWCEWVSLHELGLPRIKTKVDTGAKTSCLHAFSVEPFQKNGTQWVRFGMHPNQDDTKTEVYCEAEVYDQRQVTDSGGHIENRYVIRAPLTVQNTQWPIEITLTNRDTMKFRMLLGRQAMRDKMLVNPAESYLLGKPKKKLSLRK